MKDTGVKMWPMANQEELYERHAEYVRRVVPEGQLYYFDVREGWGPLCEVLGVDVPDRTFPHEMPRSWLTSGQAAMTAKLRRRLLMLLLGFLVAVGFVFWRWRSGLRVGL